MALVAGVIVLISDGLAVRRLELIAFTPKEGLAVVLVDTPLVKGVHPCLIACFLVGIMRYMDRQMSLTITQAMVVFG